MAYTPQWHYNTAGGLTNDQRNRNAKNICYYLLDVFNFTSIPAVLSVLAWIDYLALENPGYIDNGSYSNQNGHGLLLWPYATLSNWCNPWYDGDDQMYFLDSHASASWTGTSPFPTWNRFKYIVYSGDIEQDIPTCANNFYYYYLRQFIINIPEASYGGDINDAMRQTLTQIGMHFLPMLNEWIRADFEEAPAWLLFSFNKKKGGGKLIL